MERGEPVRVVILGAGIAGLSAAYFLDQAAPVEILVLEREELTGGLARTVERDGFHFDLGIHGHFPSSRESEPYYRLTTEILGEEKLPASKATSIFFRGRLISYPLGVKELFLSLPPWEMFLCGLDFIGARLRRKFLKSEEGKSFYDLITSRFGGRLYRIYFGPYAEKTWGIGGHDLDGRHLFRRVTTVSLTDVIVKAFRSLLGLGQRSKRSEYPQQPPACYYGKTGSHVLVDRMVKHFDPKRVRIAAGARIVELGLDRGRIATVAYEQKGKRMVEEVDFVISTIPLTDLAGHLFQEDYSDRLRYRAMILVHVAISGPGHPQQWVYFPDERCLFNRMNNYSRFSPEISPPGTAAVNFEITCFEGDSVWALPDGEVAGRVLEQAGELGFLDRSRVLRTYVTRLRHAYPVYRVDTDEHLEKLRKRLSIGNLFLAGRQGRFFYINMDEAMAQGFEAARRVKEAIDVDASGI